MTRPQIIRADTIDLQDKTSPTAQDHSTQPTHPAPYGIGPAAPHQQAAIRHAEEERQAEEVRLQKAWTMSGSTLRDDPGSDDDVTIVTSTNNSLQHDEQAVRLNGSMSMEGDDADLHDADMDDDLDDDMMDKISSSPSIDDGGYPPSHSDSTSTSAPWPIRRESLTPFSSPLHSSPASSSPFTDTPPHFPLPAADARRPLRVPARDVAYSLPVSFQSSLGHTSQSTEHHLREYAWTRTTPGPNQDAEAETEVSMSLASGQLSNVAPQPQFVAGNMINSLTLSLEHHQRRSQQPHDMSSAADDPFVETAASPPRPATGTPPLMADCPEDEQDSWTTDSEADSWAETLDQDYHDASNDVSFSDDARLIDSGWGGECLRETEDIDFEFVYALHTFVATVEGQANATKGDTMVLLDDSNSYWWLVRIVKDSSIGYLPAEHIETPTERLARLNKHRNIDLSATMLGDTAEKTKNPLKKAMRRRNAKTVQFGNPTYVEASDYDYSSDEGDGELFGGPEPKQMQQEEQEQQQEEAAAKAEAEQASGNKVQAVQVNGANGKSQAEGDRQRSSEDLKREDEKRRASDEALDKPLDPKVSRNGTLRNTDSFFKDENTETRKITLTPNLLRDDSSPSATVLRERGPSLESLEKNGFADKVKDKKDKKEKKGMLSGLFKRKDKKAKGFDAQDSDMEKSEELERSQSKPSEETTERPSIEQAQPQTQTPAPAPAAQPARAPSKGKLQKIQRTRDDSPQKTKGILKNDSPVEPMMQSVSTLDAQNGKPVGPQASTMRAVSPEQEDSRRKPIDEPRASEENRPSPSSLGSNNPFSKMVEQQQNGSPRLEEVKAPKQRMQLDDFDSDEGSDPFADPEAQKKSAEPEISQPSGRLSESPVHVTAADAQPPSKSDAQERDREPDPRHPPGLTTDNSSQETSSPVSTPTPDDSPQKTVPEHANGTAFRDARTPSPANATKSMPAPTRPAPIPTKTESADLGMSPPISSDSAILPAWSDASLRAYLDDGSDIRDMLLVVNDTTGVLPVGKDHPFMKDLFVEESKTVQGMSGELDRLLSGLLNKRLKRESLNASRKNSSQSPNGRAPMNGRVPVR